MESGGTGELLRAMTAGTLILLVTLGIILAIGARLVLRTEREKRRIDADDAPSSLHG